MSKLTPARRPSRFVASLVMFVTARPAFVDDLSYALIGPMFVAAKLLRRLGLRRDLAPYL